MSLGETLFEKTLDYAIQNPQQAVSLGRTAVGALSNAAEEDSPFRPYLVGAGVGLVVGFMLAAWICSPAKIKRNEDHELLRRIRKQARLRGHRPATLRPRQ